jgi:cupin fold WbuC family metalloprotein
MKLVSNSDIDKLYIQASQSPRLRSHLNLHNDYEEKVQRLLIAMKKGSYVEPHYHKLPHQ